MTPKLHRLPNGAWIDPTCATGITPRPEYEHVGGHQVIVTGRGIYYAIPFSDFSDAQAYADTLAEVVNAAREAGEIVPTSPAVEFSGGVAKEIVTP